MVHFSLSNTLRVVCLMAFICISTIQISQAQNFKRMKAARTNAAPKIDGSMEDAAWKRAEPVGDFIKFYPNPGESSAHKTEVRILYDNKAVYIGAVMYVSDPDKVGLELSVRDDINVRADRFEVFFDNYGKGQNATSFGVTAGGVQYDAFITPENEDIAIEQTELIRTDAISLDEYMSAGAFGERAYQGIVPQIKEEPLAQSGGIAWDGVWKSATQTFKNAWVAEIRIPYSTLRFPDKDIQTWRINFKRVSDKDDEVSFWSEVDAKKEGFVSQFGRVQGIKRIEPPARLSFTPYLVTRSKLVPDLTDDRGGNKLSSALSAGMDLRIGINETTTLDMSLVPDFGQVAFDEVQLNLGPFEQRFDENRPFFTEGFELFNRAGIFYSRRIAEEPLLYRDIIADAALPLGEQQILNPGEELVENPFRPQLINATKLTSRSRTGVGVGFFNALTAKSLARVRTGTNGSIFREIETGPMTNYNAIVLDQLLPNNSHVSFINTNVIRRGIAPDANVSGVEYRLSDNSNNYIFMGRGSISQLFLKEDDGITGRGQSGFSYGLKAGKFSGNLRYSIERNVESRSYDANDLGFSTFNRILHKGKVEYKNFKSLGALRNFNLYGGINHEQRFAPRNFANYFIDAGFWFTLQNETQVGFFTDIFPRSSNDYFEPRQEDRFFIIPRSFEMNTFISTDVGKAISYTLKGGFRQYPDWSGRAFFAGIAPRLRLSNHFNTLLEFDYEKRTNDYGFVDVDTDGSIIMGRRDRRDLTSAITGNILFSPKMSITVRARHYWALVDYALEDGEPTYFQLREDGTLRTTLYNNENSRSFNAFNIDLIYRFRFAPGSEFNIIWKRSLLNDNTPFTYNFGDNWGSMGEDLMGESILTDNLFSLKFLYYLDYLTIRRNRR